MALRTSSAAAEGSAISPLRTPRERAWPMPTILSAPAALTSPTTAQTLEVPISRPTIIELGSGIFFLESGRFDDFQRFRGNEAGFQPAGRQIVGDRQIEECQVLASRLA